MDGWNERVLLMGDWDGNGIVGSKIRLGIKVGLMMI